MMQLPRKELRDQQYRKTHLGVGPTGWPVHSPHYTCHSAPATIPIT
jgi:hypothetical protein